MKNNEGKNLKNKFVKISSRENYFPYILITNFVKIVTKRNRV